MNTRTTLLLAFLAGLGLTLLAGPPASAQDAAAILEKVDGYRQLSASFTLDVKLTDYDSDQLQEEMRMSGFFAGDDKMVSMAFARMSRFYDARRSLPAHVAMAREAYFS